MKRLSLCLILAIFLSGCIFSKESSTSSTKAPINPTHELIEYLSMKNPEAFSYNYTESFSMEVWYPTQLAEKNNYQYYKKGVLEALYDSDFIFFTLPNGSTYGCQKDSRGEKVIHCSIGFNEGIWNITIPRDTYKAFILNSLENYTSKNFTSSYHILGRKADCFKLSYERGEINICFDVQTGIIMKFVSESTINGRKGTLSVIARGLDLNPPPDDVFKLPKVERVD